jgi:hypothetical protein
MPCDQCYESPPVCYNGSGAGYVGYAINELVVDVADRQVVNDGTHGPGFSKPVINGEKERSEFKTNPIVGALATSTYEYETASASKELLKVKVLGVLLAVRDLEEAVDTAKEDTAVFEQLKKDMGGLTNSFNTLQVTWAKGELERSGRRLRGTGEAAQPLAVSDRLPSNRITSGPGAEPKGGRGKPPHNPRPRMVFGPVTTPKGGPGTGLIPQPCNRFHASPREMCTAGVPVGHPSGKVGWCAFSH